MTECIKGLLIVPLIVDNEVGPTEVQSEASIGIPGDADCVSKITGGGQNVVAQGGDKLSRHVLCRRSVNGRL